METDLIEPIPGVYRLRELPKTQHNVERDENKKSGPSIGEIRATDLINLAAGERIPRTNWGIRSPENIPGAARWLSESIQDFNPKLKTRRFITLKASDVLRWQMASRFVDAYMGIYPELPRRYWNDPSIISLLDTISARLKDWPNIKDIFREPLLQIGFGMATFVYGGLHVLAWSANFPSFTEQLLWRISACVVMGGIPVILIICGHMTGYNMLDVLVPAEAHDYLRDLLGNLFWPAYYLVRVVQYLAILVYVCARGYLVVECFISLSHLPAGVYEVPQWSTYFPHIS